MSKLRDKLINVVAGLGTSGDKASHTRDSFVPLTDIQLSVMYASNWMSGKIVDAPVDDALRRPREISCPSLGDTIDQFYDFTEDKKTIKLHKKTKKLYKWGRLYGGSALVVGVDQGTPDTPLRVESMTQDSLKFIHVVPRSKIHVSQVDTDINSETYGVPLFYMIAGQTIHPSRVHPVKGIELPEDVTVVDKFWGMSLIQRTEEPTKQVGVILSQLASMIFEANVDVISVKGLSTMLSSTAGQRKIIDRFKVGNTLKSNQQMMLVDGDLEEYHRKPLDVGRFPDLIMPFMSILAGASMIPATRFLNKSPDGMNATGESDEGIYLDLLESFQSEDLDDLYSFLDPIILMSVYGKIPDDWSYVYPDMHQTNKKEQSEIENKDSLTDAELLNLGVINEYHVADRVYRSDRYPAMTEEDVLNAKVVVDATDAPVPEEEDTDEEESPDEPIPEESGDETQ